MEGLYSPHLDLGSRGVPVSIEDLGSTCLTQIPGFLAMVSLPFMPTTGTTKALRPRTSLPPPQVVTGSRLVRICGQHVGVGHHVRPARGLVQGFQLAVAPEGVRADEAGVLVQEELPRWWLRVVDWLEVLSDKHVRSVDNFHWAYGSPALYTWSDEDTARSVPGKSWMRSSPRLTSAWRSMNYWPAAIQLAGLDQEPPLSCTLLMAAMRAFREGEYRTCVAHAGTAAEVALGEALRRIRNPP